jgi:hypothetical protein
MDFQTIARKIAKVAGDNSPAILTAIGVTGTVITAYLTGRACYRSAQFIASSEFEGGVSNDPRQRAKENVQLVWKEFIPPVVSGCVTITCIIMANRVGSRRVAALAAAYSLSEKSFTEYKNKVVETVGKNKERTVRDAVAQDQVTKKPPSNEVVFASEGSQLCMDGWTGRYFVCDMETIRKAVNDVNQDVHTYYAVPLSEFYDRIGLPRTESSDEVGWNTDELLELEYSATITDKGKACIVISFKTHPKADYSRHA